jgi:uncharacterized protein
VASPYEVPVAQLVRNEPAEITVSFVAPFDDRGEFTARATAESDVPAGSTVAVALRIESYDGGLRARGSITSPWRGVCRRCSIEIVDELVVPVAERFAAPSLGDEDAYELTGDVLDLAPMVHDAVFLELPIAPLCAIGCKGLCGTCGADLNESTCACQNVRDARWATLDALLVDEPGPRAAREDR